MPPRKARPRRTREESDRARSLATRERLLQATCDALVARGYAGATTVEICRRARLGRGTMLHHYPERQALMVAAVQHVFEQRLASLEEREAELGGDRIDVGALGCSTRRSRIARRSRGSSSSSRRGRTARFTAPSLA
ncbi:MAG: TetR/AcrR family transcriptional regulator [Deltaproteobacteria bacterium]|nr:TetR/AcrR family transcriptional regulator [Deltaproteobacteria bacterium]